MLIICNENKTGTNREHKRNNTAEQIVNKNCAARNKTGTKREQAMNIEQNVNRRTKVEQIVNKNSADFTTLTQGKSSP